MGTSKERDYLFDNIKGLIIFIVVWVHVVGTTVRYDMQPVNWIYTAIVFFCMSVMMFASGYFSKNLAKHTVENSIRTILIPYVLLQLTVSLAKFVVNREIDIKIFNVPFAMWYIVVLFFYRLMLPVLVRVRGVLFLSFAAAFLSGFFLDIAEYGTLGRAVSNLPFFLMGYYCTPEMVNKLRKYARLPEKLILLAIFAILTLGTSGLVLENHLDANVYQNKTTYAEAGMSGLLGTEYRILFYLIGVLAIVCFLIWFPRVKTFLCKPGRNSMFVYLFHIYIYYIIRRIPFLREGSWLNFGLATLIAVAATWFLSLDIFSRMFQFVVKKVGEWIFDSGRKSRAVRENAQ